MLRLVSNTFLNVSPRETRASASCNCDCSCRQLPDATRPLGHLPLCHLPPATAHCTHYGSTDGQTEHPTVRPSAPPLLPAADRSHTSVASTNKCRCHRHTYRTATHSLVPSCQVARCPPVLVRPLWGPAVPLFLASVFPTCPSLTLYLCLCVLCVPPPHLRCPLHPTGPSPTRARLTTPAPISLPSTLLCFIPPSLATRYPVVAGRVCEGRYYHEHTSTRTLSTRALELATCTLASSSPPRTTPPVPSPQSDRIPHRERSPQPCLVLS